MRKLFPLFILIPILGFTQTHVTSNYIDSIVHVSMSKFPHAGLAIGVIQNGKVSHLKGYGKLDAEASALVDENTLFAIASNSKAFTATALGILVDRGLMKWNDKVIDHIPEFRMYDDYVTANFTIVDLLTHRSGLGLGAGDLMFFPDGSDFTVNDVIASFQYQKPVSDFRTKYDYDNLLYVVAGEVIHRVSGKSWDQFVQDEMMKPLGMTNSVGIYQNIHNNANIAAPHQTVDGEVHPIAPYTKKDGSIGAAGGIYSNVSDMCKWVQMHLQNGKYGDSLKNELISTKNHRELWKLHTMVNSRVRGGGPYNAHYYGYGLGFFIEDQNGYTVVSHTGGLPGMLSMVMMIPELDAGIVVLTNADPGGYSFLTLTNEIKEKIMGADKIDWIDWADKRLASKHHEEDSVVSAIWQQVERAGKTKINHKDYLGIYRDNWFGDVQIYEKDGELWFKSLRSPKLHGKMSYYNATTFAISWDYRDMNCDAFATFQTNENGKAISIIMKGISPNIDFSFDFHDLDLKRVGE